MRQTYESWVHGHSVLLERVGSVAAVNKDSVDRAYGRHAGDAVNIGDNGAAACFRIGWAARFVVVDLGEGDAPKSGNFWVHYAVPTFARHSGVRTRANRVFVNYESSNIRELGIAALHVWDGNVRIFHNDAVPGSAVGFNGGIGGALTEATATPNPTRLLTVEIGSSARERGIFLGVGVSLLISARSAKDSFLEIRGVGVEFSSEDRTV
jgi:hypothetical protein